MTTLVQRLAASLPQPFRVSEERLRCGLLRFYFFHVRRRYAIGVALIGFLALPSVEGFVIVVLGLSGLAATLWLRRVQPTDEDVDCWLEEDILRLEKTARRRTGMEAFSSRPALSVWGPVFQPIPGISKRDCLSRLGTDDRRRSSVYQVLIMILSDQHLAAYSCTVNRLKGLVLSVTLSDFRYRDIVAVEVHENLEVDDGASRNRYQIGRRDFNPTQVFRLAIANGEEVKVPVEVSAAPMLGGASRPMTQVDKVIQRLRTYMREAKDS